LKELSTEKRSTTSVEFSEKLTQTFKNLPVPEWADVLDHGDYPKSMFVNFGCLVSTVVNVLLPDFVADKVIHFASNALLITEDADFVYN